MAPDRHPMTPQVDGREKEGEVLREEVEGVRQVTGVNRAMSGHQAPPSAIRTTPVCLVIKMNYQKLTAVLFSLFHSLLTHMQIQQLISTHTHKTNNVLLADLRKLSSYDNCP